MAGFPRKILLTQETSCSPFLVAIVGCALVEKSRVCWIRKGDKNIKFFHQSTIIQMHRNWIQSLRTNSGQWVDTEEEVRQENFDFFKLRWRFSLGGWCQVPLCPPPVNQVDVQDNTIMIRAVSTKEVWRVLQVMAKDKALGPWSLSPLFFRHYQAIVQHEMVEAIQQFIVTSTMPKVWKQTFITLLLKRQYVFELGYYMPISLCSTLYKDCTKIMIGRVTIFHVLNY